MAMTPAAPSSSNNGNLDDASSSPNTNMQGDDYDSPPPPHAAWKLHPRASPSSRARLSVSSECPPPPIAQPLLTNNHPAVSSLKRYSTLMFPDSNPNPSQQQQGAAAVAAVLSATTTGIGELAFEEAPDDDVHEYSKRDLPKHACKYCGIHNPACIVPCNVCHNNSRSGGNTSGSHIVNHLETEKKEVDAQKQLFDDYCIEFSKQYSPREREVRFSYFVASCKEIAEINEQQGHPVAGLSVFSDRSESERDFMRGSDDLLPDEFYSVACANNIYSDLSATTHEPESPTSSSSIDWVKAGVVSPQVRSQYQDQCWANASIECVESRVRLDSSCQSKERLSVQQVVDCLFDCPKTSLFDRPKTSTTVFSYGMEKGFLREEDYPTTGLPKTCESEGLRLLHKPQVFLTSLLPADMRSNEAKLKEHLKECPQYVTIGNDPALAHYRGGIITSCKCKTDTKNHPVLLCGCSKQDRIKYWRFKNSWGEAWGERGFFRLVGNKGMCRIGQFFNRAGKTKVSDPSFMKEPKSREDVKEAKGGAGSCRVQSVGCCSFCSWCWH